MYDFLTLLDGYFKSWRKKVQCLLDFLIELRIFAITIQRLQFTQSHEAIIIKVFTLRSPDIHYFFDTDTQLSDVC